MSLTRSAQSQGNQTHDLLVITEANISLALNRLAPARGSDELSMQGACQNGCKHILSLGHFEVQEPKADDIRFKETKYCTKCNQMYIEDEKTTMKRVRGKKQDYVKSLLAKQAKKSTGLEKPLELKLWTPRQKSTTTHQQPEMQMAATGA